MKKRLKPTYISTLTYIHAEREIGVCADIPLRREHILLRKDIHAIEKTYSGDRTHNREAPCGLGRGLMCSRNKRVLDVSQSSLNRMRPLAGYDVNYVFS